MVTFESGYPPNDNPSKNNNRSDKPINIAGVGVAVVSILFEGATVSDFETPPD